MNFVLKLPLIALNSLQLKMFTVNLTVKASEQGREKQRGIRHFGWLKSFEIQNLNKNEVLKVLPKKRRLATRIQSLESGASTKVATLDSLVSSLFN